MKDDDIIAGRLQTSPGHAEPCTSNISPAEAHACLASDHRVGLNIIT